MSAITVNFDNELEFKDIIVPLMGPQDNEVGENNGNMFATAQTMIQGVCTPLLSICGIVFDIEQIISLTLYNDDYLPSMRAVINDSNQLLGNISFPGRDNEIRLQILPPFENAYKKINLTFFIDNINVNGSNVTVTGKYKVNDLYSSRLECLGEINTYDLFEYIAHRCKLGFASNCDSSDIDKRYVYVNNMSYNALLNKQIKYSGNTNVIYDYWVDLWNNINLADIRERYNSQDPDEEMQVWVQSGWDIQIQKNDPIKPIQQLALLNNNPNEASPLKVRSYKIITDTGYSTEMGTDQVYTFYKNKEVIDTLIQDSAVKRDVFLKYVYLGENIGDYDYLIAEYIRKSFFNIMNCTRLEVTLDFPSLALMRGHQCKFIWYDNNLSVKGDMEMLDEITTNIDLPNRTEENISDPNSFVINKQISGQYLITGVVIKYDRGKWTQKLTLVRPQDKQNKLFNND